MQNAQNPLEYSSLFSAQSAAMSAGGILSTYATDSINASNYPASLAHLAAMNNNQQIPPPTMVDWSGGGGENYQPLTEPMLRHNMFLPLPHPSTSSSFLPPPTSTTIDYGDALSIGMQHHQQQQNACIDENRPPPCQNLFQIFPSIRSKEESSINADNNNTIDNTIAASSKKLSNNLVETKRQPFSCLTNTTNTGNVAANKNSTAATKMVMEMAAVGKFDEKKFRSEMERAKYLERRSKNNEAAKHSRTKRREREQYLNERVAELERENRLLREELAKERRKNMTTS